MNKQVVNLASVQSVCQQCGIYSLCLPMGLEIGELSLDRRGAWSMQLSNGTRVQLGRESARERLQRLLVSWDSLMLEEAAPPQDVDLRYTNGFAVLWPQPETIKGTDS